MRPFLPHAMGLLVALAITWGFGSPVANAATIELDVRASSAPNAFGSPSWGTYTTNALNSLKNDLGNVGDRATSPTAYEILSGGYALGDVMVTSFNSWRGEAGAASPFDGEYGNRLHFGLAAVSSDGSTTFTLADVNYSITSTDGVLDFAGDLSGTTLNGTTRIGLNYGSDGIRGTADDIWYTSGEDDTTLLNALFYVGVGNAYWPGGPGDTLTGQAAIDSVAAYIRANNVGITGAYSINGFNGQADLRLVPLPPAALAGLALMGGLGLVRRLRKRMPA